MKAVELKERLKVRYTERTSALDDLEAQVRLECGVLAQDTLIALKDARAHALKRVQEEQDDIDKRVIEHQERLLEMRSRFEAMLADPDVSENLKSCVRDDLTRIEDALDFEPYFIETSLDAAFDVWEHKIREIPWRLNLEAAQRQLNTYTADVQTPVYRAPRYRTPTPQSSTFSLKLLAALPLALGVTLLIAGLSGGLVPLLVAGGALMGVGFFMTTRVMSTPKPQDEPLSLPSGADSRI